MTSMPFFCKILIDCFAFVLILSAKHTKPITCLFSVKKEIVKALFFSFLSSWRISSEKEIFCCIKEFLVPKKYSLPLIIPEIPFPTKF